MLVHFLRSAGLVLAAALAGCATVSPDAGRAEVQALVADRIGAPATLAADADSAQAATRDALSVPLTPEAAVQVALLNNASLGARLAELGIGAADLAQASRLPNPRFAYDNKRNAEIATIDRGVMVSVLALVTLPLATEAAQRQYDARKLAVAAAIVRIAHDTRRAWYTAVAAQELLRYAGKVSLAAEAARDLARRMEQAGNFSALASLREQAFATEATRAEVDARLAAATAREDLARLMGIDDAAFLLPERLPDPPPLAVAASAVDIAVTTQRLDVMAARHELDATAARLGLTRATRFVNVLEVGYVNESQTGEGRQNGYAIEIEIPLFDWGDARVARAESEYLRSAAQLRATALGARSELRASHAAWRARHELARHYRDEVVPMRERMAAESLLRYNAMQIGVFELLDDARAQVVAVSASIAALRDFWLADANLAMAMRGTGSTARTITAVTGTVREAGRH